MTDLQRIQDFVAHWTDKGYEKGESQPFWIDLLLALGVPSPAQYIRFEDQVHLDHTSFIDGHIPATHVLIEQKSITKDLGAPIRQSDGSQLNPFQQAKRYASELPYSQRPRWIVTCNFREFWIYDMEQPNAEPTKVLLENLEKEYYLLGFLVKKQDEHLQREMELSMRAGELVGRIYDKLILQYRDPTHPETLRSLNQLCVRLVFLLFAEDAELFDNRSAFHDYMAAFPAGQWRNALIALFRVLDTPVEERDPYLEDDLKAFPYVNGGLFSDEHIEIPQFTEELKDLILTKASADFDWSEISPTIFGGVFESTLNPETRRSGGMHYTSIENIHKVIDPLFMHQLEQEYAQCTGKRDLLALQDKLASLTFFDPACGSGNFLTETYISIRRLENKIIARLQGGQAVIGEFVNPIKVDIHQFYGIEINDFAVSVATTAL
ncbi:MAG: type IIL restriction-modification enzyme MmeI, partial [Paludibacteraceae bacterium]|nr:type IIL restriction-modification enzyme MmeI [Paludibacteraceae bacterium]